MEGELREAKEENEGLQRLTMKLKLQLQQSSKVYFENALDKKERELKAQIELKNQAETKLSELRKSIQELRDETKAHRFKSAMHQARNST